MRSISNIGMFIELFPHCNLNCTFCHQRNIAPYKAEYNNVLQLPKSYYVNKCLATIKEHNLKTDNLFIMGGELFYDNNVKYIDSMKALISYLSPKECINVTSNLVFDLDKSELFNYLIQFPQFCLSVSYNVCGRYANEKQLQLFTSNVKRLYKDFYKRPIKLSVEIVLQEDLLKNDIEVPFLYYIKEINELYGKSVIDVTFLMDYRGYSKDFCKHFNEYMLKFLLKYPVFEDIAHLYSPRNTDKFCACTQPTTKCLSYVNNFKVPTEITSCIDGSINFDELKDKLERCYKCSTCPYSNYCKDVCLSGLDKAGLLSDGQYCFNRFLFDNYDVLIKKYSYSIT